MVVVDLGRSLAVVGAEDAAGLLDEPTFLGDGCGEEEGVQRGAVEPFPGVWAGRHGEYGRAARLGLEPGERGGPCFGAHAAAQDDGVDLPSYLITLNQDELRLPGLPREHSG